jgi:hypothetical protein
LAWNGLLPSAKNATQLWQEGLEEILAHLDYLESQSQEMEGLRMSTQWKQLMRERGPQRASVQGVVAGIGAGVAQLSWIKITVKQRNVEEIQAT